MSSSLAVAQPSTNAAGAAVAGPSPPLQQMPVTTTASPSAMAAWRKFEQCLALQGLTFDDVKDADAGARLDMIASIGGTSLVFGGDANGGDSNSTTADVAATVLAAAQSEAPPSLSGVEMALVSSRWNALVPTAASGAAIPAMGSQYGGPSTASVNNHATSYGGGAVQSTLPFLDPTHGRALLHRGTTDLLDELRRHLSVGNSAPALAIASELLHRDPVPMLRVLHEFAPHMSLPQLQDILGVRAASATAANGSSSSAFAAGLHLTGSALGPGGFNGSPTMDRRLIPTLNDIPLRVGAVLTEGALSAQFGVGFRATFAVSGRQVQLPHCVQEGDSIMVLKSSEVIR